MDILFDDLIERIKKEMKKKKKIINFDYLIPIFLPFLYSVYIFYNNLIRGNPRSVVANVLDCDIVVNEFEL